MVLFRSLYDAHPECSVQVNHLSTSFVILLLLPRILKTARDHGSLSRIVLVSSELLYDITVEKDARDKPGNIIRTLASAEYLKDTR
jgi:hypothetical protein